MSSMVYPIILFIFIFGAVVGYVNETGLYTGYTIPADNIAMSEGSVQELQENMMSEEASDYSYIDWILLGGKCLLAGVAAIFTLGPLLNDMGIPVGMAGMFISPLALILVFWIIEYFTGRSPDS